MEPKIIETKKSKLSGNIRVVKSLGLGKYIQVEGLTQSGGVVKDIWRFSLSRAQKLVLSLNKVLILGLGGGSIAKLVAKTWPEAEITGVEIDEVMIELGEKHLGLKDANVKTVIEDAEAFVAQSREKYDLILVDTYVGYNFPKKFEEETFLKAVNKLLTPEGIAVFNRLYFDEYRGMAMRFGKKLEKVFSSVVYIYPEANIMFLCKR